MRYLDEYRDGRVAAKILDEIRRLTTRPWTLMEVCGGQTHSIVKHGIDRLLPEGLELVHGPGCPVCVTPLEQIDKAHAIARRPEVILTSFGDMLRVPGSHTDLLRLKSEGADARIVYAPIDAVRIAQDNPGREVVFFAIGFETTAPANALAVMRARQLGVANFSMLVSQVLVPPAIAAVLQSPGNRVQAFLGPGHVCTVMGTREYEALARHYRVPIVITGFEPVDLLDGICRAVRRLEAGLAGVENQYSRVVRPGGNVAAQRLMWSAFEVCDQRWRGIGTIPKSGLRLRYELHAHDAERRFEVTTLQAQEPAECISGQILRGLKRPPECPAFGTRCTPARPLGATMVSAEGACAAYYAHGRRQDRVPVA
ncbi:MAG TPA: hydrogenase formation protein HypD [Candidatus Binatia bacterium]|nr:hydrogenase formation protein HypD [Candidatus Binatia bacterium]